MLTDVIHVLGAGGHGHVVVDALLKLGYSPRAILVRDDRRELHGSTVQGCSIESPAIPESALRGQVHAAVGEASLRQSLLERSGQPAERWLAVVHPRASVSASASVGPAAMVAAQAVVGPCTQLHAGAIVNHGAVVDHDCDVGPYAHIAPCASLGGGVRVGARALIGAGARVLPGLHIGDDAVIGAGAVVLTDVPGGQTWVGVPARPARKDKK